MLRRWRLELAKPHAEPLALEAEPVRDELLHWVRERTRRRQRAKLWLDGAEYRSARSMPHAMDANSLPSRGGEPFQYEEPGVVAAGREGELKRSTEEASAEPARIEARHIMTTCGSKRLFTKDIGATMAYKLPPGGTPV